MSTTKVPPPRKLTENEDLDSFEDFWFQIETYYGQWPRPQFCPFNKWPKFKVGSKKHHIQRFKKWDWSDTPEHISESIGNLCPGPHIKQNILENCKSLYDIRREFMKLLEIDLSDSTFMNLYDVKRRLNERPLMFYHRLHYHVERHGVNGVALPENEKWIPPWKELSF